MTENRRDLILSEAKWRNHSENTQRPFDFNGLKAKFSVT